MPADYLVVTCVGHAADADAGIFGDPDTGGVPFAADDINFELAVADIVVGVASGAFGGVDGDVADIAASDGLLAGYFGGKEIALGVLFEVELGDEDARFAAGGDVNDFAIVGFLVQEGFVVFGDFEGGVLAAPFKDSEDVLGIFVGDGDALDVGGVGEAGKEDAGERVDGDLGRVGGGGGGAVRGGFGGGGRLGCRHYGGGGGGGVCGLKMLDEWK